MAEAPAPPNPLLEDESATEDESENNPENNPPITEEYVSTVLSAFGPVTWFNQFETLLNSESYKYPKWFSGGGVNLCYELLDRHFEGGNIDARSNAIAFYNKVWRYDDTSVPTVQYSDLLHKVRRFASWLRRREANDPQGPHRVLILLPNCLQAIISILACFRLGWLFTVFCSRFEYPIEQRIKDFKPTIIISMNGSWHRITFPKFLANILGNMKGGGVKYMYFDLKTNSLANRVLALKEYGITCYNFHAAIGDVSCELPENDYTVYDINRPLYVAYTKGVTGTPKGCIHSARSILASIFSDSGFQCRTWKKKDRFEAKTKPKESKVELAPRPVTYCVADLQHVVGLMNICVKPLYYKVPSVLFEIMIDTAEPAAIFQAIQYLKVTNVYFRRISYRILLEAFYTGEMHVASPVLRWAENLFGDLPIYQCFVVTELCGIITHHKNTPSVPRPDTDLNRDNPLGLLVPLVQARLFKNGKKMKGTCWGELFLRLPLSPMMMLYYWKNKRLTKTRFTINPGNFGLHDLINFDRMGEVVWISRSDETSITRFIYGYNELDTALTDQIVSQVLEYNLITDIRMIIRMDGLGIQKAFIFYTSPIKDLDDIFKLNRQIESTLHYIHGSQLDITAIHLQRFPAHPGDDTRVDDEQMKYMLNTTAMRDEDLNDPKYADFLEKTREIRQNFNRKYIK